MASRDPVLPAASAAVASTRTRHEQLEAHLAALRSCRRCPRMHPPVITPRAVLGAVYLVGQAPGSREGVLGRPFAWTAGRTLFRWFAGIGVGEETLRAHAYISAACRCFPGKLPQGGDRVPARAEIQACSSWMRAELELLQPRLVITIGRVASACFLPSRPLAQTIGVLHRGMAFGYAVDCLPLPHPSGASTWWQRAPGSLLLAQALGSLAEHPQWRALAAIESRAAPTPSPALS
jgi:uracil-DNA glycosylase